MKHLTLLAVIVLLSGCATNYHWKNLSNAEKAGVIVGTTVLVGALIIRNSSDHHQQQCLSHGRKHYNDRCYK